MNNEELIAFRIFLDLDINKEAAALVASDAAHINGVNRGTWQRWERGDFAIPSWVADKVNKLKKRREDFLKHLLENKTKEITIPYDLKAIDPLEFKIQLSVIYELHMKGVLKILVE